MVAIESFGIDAITNTATNIASTTATLNGTVDPNGATPLIGQFVYGTDSNLVGATTVTATTPASGTLGGFTDPTSVSLGLTSLTPGTIYYYRVTAGVATGTILSFLTNSVLAVPTVATDAVTSLTSSTATFNGTINPNLTPITAIQFVYGTSPTLSVGNATTTLDDGAGLELTVGGSSAQAFSTSTVNLSSGTTYYYKILACTASSGAFPNILCSAFIAGSIVSFTTASVVIVPSVTTSAPSSITTSAMTLNSIITSTGGSDATQSGFTYGTDNTLATIIATSTLGAQSGTASFSNNISSLSSNTTYYIRAYVTNSAGTSYGAIVSATTTDVSAPSDSSPVSVKTSRSVRYILPVTTTPLATTLSPLVTPTTPNNVNESYKPEVCMPYLTSFVRFGYSNNSDDVKKLQVFLNTYERENLEVNGIYDQDDIDAVRRFQEKHSDTLSFWNITTPTGYVYITTQKAINKIYCEQTKKLTCPYFDLYVKEGDVAEEVLKIKSFLNLTQGESLNESSNLFEASLAGAIKKFQLKYASKILTPWGIKAPTGWWYQSTRKTANDILGCFAPVMLDNGRVIE